MQAYADLALGDLRRPLAEDVKQDQEPVRASVENAIELTAIVAAKLSQLPVDLRAVWERQMGDRIAEQVEAVDLVVDRGLGIILQRVEDVPHRLVPLRASVVDGLEGPQGAGPEAQGTGSM